MNFCIVIGHKWIYYKDYNFVTPLPSISSNYFGTGYYSGTKDINGNPLPVKYEANFRKCSRCVSKQEQIKPSMPTFKKDGTPTYDPFWQEVELNNDEK